jgi:hypothetical protein
MFVANHIGDFINIGFSVIATASLFTALTPTPRDDIFIGKVYKIIEALAINVGRAKDAPPNARRSL